LAPNGAAALQKIALAPVVVIAEGYATAATIAKHTNVTAIAAFDSGNLSAVATALRERHKDKPIIIAGDDDHRLENNPGRKKAVEAAAAVKGLAVFPKLSTEQQEQGFTDFNDIGRQNPDLVKAQFESALQELKRQLFRSSEATMKLGLNPEERHLDVDTLDANHVSLANTRDNLPKVQAINVLCSRLAEQLNAIDQENTLGLQR
jgi:phage/plasmid primase-like uncharacterized protein